MRTRVAAVAMCFAVCIIVSNTGAFAGEPLDRDEVNAFDRPLMFPYSEGIHLASEVTQYSAFLMPAAFLAAAPVSDYMEIGLMYAGSSALALAAGTGLKAVIDRERPYMYFSDPPESEIENGDYTDSFPSRHTIMAFSGAAYTATVFALMYPDSTLRTPVCAVAWTLAAGTAVLRVASGSHFVSDVLAGALIGSFSGFIVPYASDRFGWVSADEGRAGFSITPRGFSATIRLD